MSNNPSSNRPTEKELNLELKGLLRWKMFALCLPEMEQLDIDEIQQNKQENTEDQKLAVFGTWLRRCVHASWEDVVSALEKIDEKTLAEQLRVKYCPVSSSLPPSSHSQPPLSTISDHRSSTNHSLTKSEQHSQFTSSVATSVYRGLWSPPVNQPTCSKFTPSLQTPHSHSSTRSDQIIIVAQQPDLILLVAHQPDFILLVVTHQADLIVIVTHQPDLIILAHQPDLILY